MQTARVEEAGLRLTKPQAQRLWGLDAEFCEAILGALVDAKFLLRTGDDVYVRIDSGAPRRITHGGRPLQVGSAA